MKPIIITTSTGTEYTVYPKLLSMMELRPILDQMREYETGRMRLRARIEVAIAHARRAQQQAEESDDFDEGAALLESAIERIHTEQAAFDAHLDSLAVLSLYVKSVKGFSDVSEIPAVDYHDLVDVVRGYVENGGQGAQSGEGASVSPTWRKPGSSQESSTQKP